MYRPKRASAWDKWLFGQVLGLWLPLATACLALQLATEELGTVWPQRLARFSMFSAPLAGLAMLIVHSVRASQLNALEALGVTPLRGRAGAVAAGWVLAALSAALWTWGGLDASSLLPLVDSAPRWAYAGGRFFEASSGVELRVDGALAFAGVLGRAVVTDPVASTRILMAATCVALGFALPLWVAQPRSRGRWTGVGIGALLSQIVAFQAVAAQQVPAISLLVGSAILLADFCLSCSRFQTSATRALLGRR